MGDPARGLPDFTSEVDDVRDLGDVTVGRHHFRAEAAGSGTPMEQRHWQVTRWRDNKAIWWQSLPTEAEALEVAGAPQRDEAESGAGKGWAPPQWPLEEKCW